MSKNALVYYFIAVILAILTWMSPKAQSAQSVISSKIPDECANDSSYAQEICSLLHEENYNHDITEKLTPQPALENDEVIRKSLQQLELETEVAIKEIGKFRITSKNIKNIDAELEPLLQQVDDKAAKSFEKAQRLEFLAAYRSALQRAKDTHEGAIDALLGLAAKERVASARDGRLNSKLWVFEAQLAVALKDIMEPRESFGDFVKAFMNKVKLSTPESLDDFIKHHRGDYLGDRPETAKKTADD